MKRRQHETDKRRVMRAYQRQVFYQSLTRTHNAFFLDMRLGKTLITIRSIVARVNPLGSVLVIAPYSAFPSWQKELTCEGFAHNEFIFLTGEKKARRKMFFEARELGAVKWFILNTEGWRAIPEIASVSWAAMIVDESYSLQSPPHVNVKPTTKEKSPCTSKFFTTNFRDVPYKYILTGTPAPESELNYFMQLLFLDKSILREDNFWKFRMKHFTQYVPHEYAIRESGRQFLAQRLSTCATFLSRKDVNLGGEKIYEQRAIEVDKHTRAIYNDILDLFVKRVDGEIFGVTDIAGVTFSWARRLLGGYVTQKDELTLQETYQYIFDGKMREMNNLLTGELHGQQVIIWADFTKEIDLLMAYMHKTGKKAAVIDGRVEFAQRDEYERAFRVGRAQYLICQPQASQYSRDFSTADTEIFYSAPLALKTRLQAEDRLISSKTNSVLVIDLVCKDTIEEDIITSLHKKERKQEMVKRIVQRLTRENR
jgi:SNF2 family DNA or RNA helicase